MSEAKKPKIRRIAYTDAESHRLITLYLENREQYHGKFKTGSKNGDSIRQTLLAEWSNEISSMGVAFRSKESIEEKIKNDVKKVQKHLREEKMEDDERERIESLISLAAPRTFRERVDPLEILDDDAFRARFRLNRRGFYSLLSILQEDLAPSTARTAAITSAHKLAIFLEHIGSANLQRITAVTLGCSQATISRIITQVSDVMYRKRHDFIKWPSEGEQQAMGRRFFALCGIPNIVGALDGSHVKIQAPTVSEDSYVNRKGYHSINMAAICDLDQRFIWVSANFSGRAHDSSVFRSSALYRSLRTGRKRGTLLADSAYRSERFILKPILRADRTPAEARYTDAVCRGRVVIENAFGSLKRQFLSLHTELRHAPTRASKIIVSACCLRNFCIETREQPFAEDEVIPQQYPEAGDDDTDVPDAGEGAFMRRSIIETYFA